MDAESLPTLLARAKAAQNEVNNLTNVLAEIVQAIHPGETAALSVDERRSLILLDVWEFIVPQLERYDNEILHAWGWRILRETVCVLDNESLAEYETIDMVVKRGAIETVAKWLKKRSRNPEDYDVLLEILAALTTMCLVQKQVDRLLKSGVVQSCVEIINEGHPLVVTTPAVGILKNLALHPKARPFLLQCGALEAALPRMANLRAEEVGQLKLGLAASSLVCRLTDGQETGPGSDIIRETNGLVVSRLRWLLDSVLRMGPVILGSGWNIANIILDISILSKLDQNKEILIPMIPLLVMALVSRGTRNLRMTEYAFEALLSISLADSARFLLLRLRGTLIRVITTILKHERNQVQLSLLQSTLALREKLINLGADLPPIEDLHHRPLQMRMDQPD